MSTKKDKTTKPKPEPEAQVQSEKKGSKLTPEIIIAIIGLIGTVVTAIVAPILVENWRNNAATPTTAATEIPNTQVIDTPTVVVQGFTPVVSPGDDVNSKGVVMVLVPAGKFTMGGNNGGDDEMPLHDVYLDAYFIDKYEVTNSLYKDCVESGICKLPSDVRRYDDLKYANHPVVYVNWEMAQTYCEWRGTRLPTEAEWEKAARGTYDRLFPWGDTASCEQANYANCVGETTEVGKYKNGTSPYGVYDMAGNVWEWVADWYLSDYYQILGSDALNPQGPASGENRSARGGGFGYDSFSMRVFNRSWGNTFYNDTGFRCARSETTSVPATAIVTLTASDEELNLPTDIVDDKNVTMVLVPSGEFTMGTDDEDVDSSVQPAHNVYLSAFYIDRYEVTNVLYKACVDVGFCSPSNFSGSATRDSYFGNSEYNDFPVISITWDMANTYCEWRSARLPTEAEWEKAARGTDGRTFPWGEEIDESLANYSLNLGDTVAVGSYESGKSFFGVYDMAGNVYEWTADWYATGYYKTSPFENPLGPRLGKSRVARGGSFAHPLNVQQTYVRNAQDPTSSFNDMGFRCAKAATP